MPTPFGYSSSGPDSLGLAAKPNSTSTSRTVTSGASYFISFSTFIIIKFKLLVILKYVFSLLIGDMLIFDIGNTFSLSSVTCLLCYWLLLSLSLATRLLRYFPLKVPIPSLQWKPLAVSLIYNRCNTLYNPRTSAYINKYSNPPFQPAK